MSTPNFITAKFISTLDPDSLIDSRIANAIEALWQDSGIKSTYNMRHMYQVFNHNQKKKMG